MYGAFYMRTISGDFLARVFTTEVEDVQAKLYYADIVHFPLRFPLNLIPAFYLDH